MHPVPTLAAVLSFAAAVAAALEPGHAAARGRLPAWALFSFAVSAFREPLR